MTPLLDRLREVGCNREPFTPEHAQCICRLTNEAASEIERLRTALQKIRQHARDAHIGDDVGETAILIADAALNSTN